MSMKPLLRFGMISDVQYADDDDKKAWYNENKTRFYRNSLKQVEKAFQHWKNYESDSTESTDSVSFIIQLGDIIDALNKNKCSQTAMYKTLACFLNNPKMPTFHTVGNHELYNFHRSKLALLFDEFMFSKNSSNHHHKPALNVVNPGRDSDVLYYKFNPRKGIKFISLDTYDISVLGYESTHPNYLLASNILKRYHGHEDFHLWDTDHHLKGEEKRFQSSNGAISDEQLKWLDHELTLSDQINELVIVFGHIGLHPKSCEWDSILWNYDQVLQCFNRHSSVVAYFNGHAHNSGYAFENNIHFIVLHGIIETHPNQDAFVTVSIFDDHMIIDGRGVEKQVTIEYHKTFDFKSTIVEKVDDLIAESSTLKTTNAIKIVV